MKVNLNVNRCQYVDVLVLDLVCVRVLAEVFVLRAKVQIMFADVAICTLCVHYIYLHISLSSFVWIYVHYLME